MQQVSNINVLGAYKVLVSQIHLPNVVHKFDVIHRFSAMHGLNLMQYYVHA